MCDLVLTQTTVSDGHRALASASVVNSPAPVARAAGCMVGAGFGRAAWIGAGRGAGAGAAAGAGAGAAEGAAAGAEDFWARQDLRNSCQVWPLVVLFALAAFHSSPHAFITLTSARAAPLARLKAAATRKAENATFND